MHTGSLIKPNWVVTAAHCLPQTSKAVYELVAGEYDLSITSGNEQIRNISDFIVHPEYYRNGVGYDIGLVRPNKPFSLNRFVKTITLPPRNFMHFSFLRVYGWGSRDPNGGDTSNILQRTYIYLIPYAACEEVLMLKMGEIPLHPTELCAGNLDGSTDTCEGDSGGPLVQNNPSTGKFELVAIVSWGPYPCNIDRPSINTRVSAFVDWIAENTS